MNKTHFKKYRIIILMIFCAALSVLVPKNTYASSDSKRTAVVNYALGFVGNRYVWGGTNPYDGADCSGFVQFVMRNTIGHELPRVSYEQAETGFEVSETEAQPGDLVFYDTNGNGTVSHVAIYLGGGRIVHAASKKSGVIISNADYRRPMRIMNVIDEEKPEPEEEFANEE